jgi:hypothetical protein
MAYSNNSNLHEPLSIWNMINIFKSKYRISSLFDGVKFLKNVKPRIYKLALRIQIGLKIAVFLRYSLFAVFASTNSKNPEYQNRE